MNILIASDHGGAALKRFLSGYLTLRGFHVEDLGTRRGDESVDYPLYAFSLARRVASTEDDCLGIAICGTGIGMSIAANKVPGIRAALVHDKFTAIMARRHNNANILCLGGRVLDKLAAARIVEAFIDTKFEGGRHARRIGLIHT